MSTASPLMSLLLALPGSYAGPTRPEEAPHAVVGVGEGTLAAHLAQGFAPQVLARSGTQLVLSSPDAQAAATDYGDLAEVAGASTRRVSTGGAPGEIDVLVPGGPLATYHFAQFVAYATGHSDQAQAADRLMTDLAARCAPHVEEDNPARDLAWSLWGRMPLLLAAPDADALPHAWQALLARMGKTLAVPVVGDPLPVVSSAFEAQHEKGDAKVAVLLGDPDPALHLTREILESRIDEVIHVPYPGGEASGYAAQLTLWYFGAWVAAYLAERYSTDAADPAVLGLAQAVLSGEDADRLNFNAGRDDLRRTDVIGGWRDDDEEGDVEEDYDPGDDEDDSDDR
ncbi:SIS domain-containing protein [Deinococcus deserti]|uniref:Phosphosugar isomerase n=1 Tax=Deinococcus deserti (strain DSM 17065 / CIP 109153 / LMG 22923 / VCD115) TaxID=546414 RepID=C1D145_DEIDV|nr:SIS domain-containing protein [Deinococcus deserti]ACO45569.2 hypothetical protein Deide_07120 [Deinococcus deserti VCD115]